MLLSLVQHASTQSNEGTEFWFTFLQHRDQSNTRVCMVTSKYDARGIIEFPATGWSQDINISANTVQIIPIPGEAEMLTSEQIDETGVRVNMDVPSSVYIHQFHQFRSDATLVLPNPSLGSEYYIMCYTAYQNEGIHYASEFAIVGIEDQTEITITVSANTRGGILKGSSWKIVLNKAQTYQVQGATLSDDLTGSHVMANKAIAVFSGNRWTQVPRGCGNRDNLLEQMIPIDSWGKEFIMVPTKNTTNDIFRILSSSDNTLVEIFDKGQLLNQSFTLNKGEWKELRMDANARYLRATQAVMVSQFLVGGECNGHNEIGDPAMVLLNSIEQYRDTVTLYNSPFENITENYVNIVMKSQDTSSFRLDGNAIFTYGEIFRTLGPSDEFAYAQIEVRDGPHTLIGGGCGVIAIAYGYGRAESYAYGGGANFNKINHLPLPDGACLNDTIIFKSGLPENRYSVVWDFGNGSQSTLHETSKVFNKTGKYLLKLRYTSLCLNKMDSITKEFLVTLRRDLSAFGDTAVCEGESISLVALDLPNVEYSWSGPDHFQSGEQFPVISNISLDQQGYYKVTGVLSGCASYPDSVQIIVNENPSPWLGNDTFFCTRNGFIQLDPGHFINYTWHNGFLGYTIEVREEGYYSVEVENEFGCRGSDTIFVAEKCPVSLFVPNSFSPNGDNINDVFLPRIEFFLNYSLEIFDRWGNLLFKSLDPEAGWNGIHNGIAVMPGVYIYIIQYSGYDEKGILQKKQKAGDLTVSR